MHVAPIWVLCTECKINQRISEFKVFLNWQGLYLPCPSSSFWSLQLELNTARYPKGSAMAQSELWEKHSISGSRTRYGNTLSSNIGIPIPFIYLLIFVLSHPNPQETLWWCQWEQQGKLARVTHLSQTVIPERWSQHSQSPLLLSYPLPESPTIWPLMKVKQ